MTDSSDGETPPRRLLAAGAAISFSLLLGMWIALVGAFDIQDLVAGAVAASVSVGVGYLISQRGRALPSFHRGDLRLFAGLLPRMFTETVEVYVQTARRARHGGQPSRLRTVATDAQGGGWRGARRSAVIGAVLSATPNTVLVDIDAGGMATVHEFVVRGDDAGA
ncbi:MAG: Na+/H+ antiporter subunit E [Acidimicrobiales bacterium]